ncbi:MAG: hypothetical protein MPJ78_08605 [Hyphomicrobiaceae bacterium]|nr:hypothetical protein [Hyphomicrobiaceae bacterium]
MKQLQLCLCLLLGVTLAASAFADEKSETAIAGSYFITQDDKFQRVLTFEPGGAISQVSDQQTLLGFSSGQGSWKLTGPGTVKASVIDFSYDLKTGKRVGPGIINYEVKFTDERSGKYQSISGSFSGSVYPVGDNPLKPSKQPVYSFAIGFKGGRIGAE